MRPRTVLVVGAGLAGSRCAERLRAEGFAGRILVVGDEPVAPYERPALSKDLLAGAKDADALRLRAPDWWAEQAIELRLGTRIERIDLGRRQAVTSRGEILDWDALVLATGARARCLPGPRPEGVHVLRTLADALALREELQPGARLVVVGAGFIGAEAASTALGLGVEVTLVDPVSLPLLRALGPEVGRLLADRYRAAGVELRLGLGVEALRTTAGGRVQAVALDDGEALQCDAVLVGIGVQPAVELVGAGAAPTGIATDACGRTGLGAVYACGDVAAAWRPSLGTRTRVEHWTNAAGQAAAVAAAICGREAPHDDLPYFWSDQFGLRLQHVGHADAFAEVELDGTPDAFTARYLASDGRLLAALAANQPRAIGALRRELAGAEAVPLAA